MSKGQRPRRKIVIFLVEGKSDRNALQLVISEMLDLIDETIEPKFPMIMEDDKEKGGDITTTYNVWPRNIENAIYEHAFKAFFDQEKIMPKDVAQVVQIVDMDGAYIPDSNIVEGANPTGQDKPFYAEDAILTERVEHIKKRNEQKRENLDYLCSLQTIKIKSKSVPYAVFYFSSNLDHFLHHDANLNPWEKVKEAERFSNSRSGEEFINFFIYDSDASLNMSYEQSWDFIRQGTNSLQRHTNLDLLIEGLMKRIKME